MRYRNLNIVRAVSELATVVSAGPRQRLLLPVTTSPGSDGLQIRLSFTDSTSCHPLYSAWVAAETRMTCPRLTGAVAAVPVRPRVLSANEGQVVGQSGPPRRFTRIRVVPVCTVTVSLLRVMRFAACDTEVSVRCAVGR